MCAHRSMMNDEHDRKISSERSNVLSNRSIFIQKDKHASTLLEEQEQEDKQNFVRNN
jgi:hypothetical protein